MCKIRLMQSAAAVERLRKSGESPSAHCSAGGPSEVAASASLPSIPAPPSGLLSLSATCCTCTSRMIAHKVCSLCHPLHRDTVCPLAGAMYQRPCQTFTMRAAAQLYDVVIHRSVSYAADLAFASSLQIWSLMLWPCSLASSSACISTCDICLMCCTPMSHALTGIN